MKLPFTDEIHEACQEITDLLDGYIVMSHLSDQKDVKVKTELNPYYGEWSIIQGSENNFIIRICTNIYGPKYSFDVRSYWFSEMRILDPVFGHRGELDGGWICYSTNEIPVMGRALAALISK
jgi:hypothetical protein